MGCGIAALYNFKRDPGILAVKLGQPRLFHYFVAQTRGLLLIQDKEPGYL